LFTGLLKVLEIRALKTAFGLNGQEARGGCRMLFNVELHDFHRSPHVSMVIRSRNITRDVQLAWGNEKWIYNFYRETSRVKAICET
jgi:hypothetical protein